MSKRVILFRVDGSRELGLGHIMRCIEVAKALQKISLEKKIETGIIFVSRNFDGAHNVFDNSDFKDKVVWIQQDADESIVLKGILRHVKPRAVVVDIDLRGRMQEYLAIIYPYAHVSLHEHNFQLACGDRVIAPTIRELQHHANAMPEYSCFNGPDYVILPLEILDLRESTPEPSLQAKIATVTMGGGDPLRLTELVLDAVRAVNMPSIEWRVILGPASDYDKGELEGKYPISVNYIDGKYLSRGEFLKHLAESDLVITNAGTTVYEAIALGRPVLSIPQNDFERVVAGLLIEKGVVVTPEKIDRISILASLAGIIENHTHRHLMAQRGKILVDGRGALRVANIILEISGG